ncbi:MAG: hypothetical protein HY748_16930 [Elusimicrobia bacterium]|nr:hypothetical protein [Elusimicrobiota bacterium]
MNRILRPLLPSMFFFMAGCDPGMSIRQTDSWHEAAARSGAAGSEVAIHVKTGHPLIGETWYVPEVTITNASDKTITVSSVKLATSRASYVNKPRQAGSYPLVVSPGDTKPLDVWFHLDEPVGKIFERPVELKVHYRSGAEESMSRATLAGEPPNAN